MVNKITETFEKKLQVAIDEIESQSHIEIVPVISKRASNYYAWSLVFGLITSFTLLLIVKFFFWNFWHSLSFVYDLPVFILLGYFFAYLIRQSPLFRFLVPRNLQQQRVITQSEAYFATERVFDTKNRLGILICVFEFEQMALVFADKGFDGIVENDFWKNLGGTLAKNFDTQNPGEEFIEALFEIKNKVLPHFNSVEDAHVSELPDHLRKK
jgi:uncharacterized membrane protein